MIAGISVPTPLRPPEQAGSPLAAAGGQPAGEPFDNMLGKLIKDVDHAQKAADSSLQSLAAGEPHELHEVVLKLEEADLTFKMMHEIRDKLVQAYKEIISLQS